MCPPKDRKHLEVIFLKQILKEVKFFKDRNCDDKLLSKLSKIAYYRYFDT